MRPVFCFDVGSPYAYIAAERIENVLPVAPTWRPVLLGGLFRATGRGSWADTDMREAGIAEVESRASGHGLPPVAWPEPWPNDGLLAMRAAVAAESFDRTAEFARAAMRTQFCEGAPLSDPDVIARAATAARIPAEELLRRAADASTKNRLREHTDRALAAGVEGVPSIVCPDGAVFWGDDELERAATHLLTADSR